ncbi:MAG: type II toxin-antitoxin system VapC family toxin [Gaiellaceae bacterium]
MIVLDTTVLVYAVGADHPLADASRGLIESIARGDLDATTTPEVLQEFTHVRARRRTRADAAALARELAELLAPLLVVKAEHLAAGLDLYEGHADLGAFDAVLAAVALAADADALVSTDRAFSAVPNLRTLGPGDPELTTG